MPSPLISNLKQVLSLRWRPNSDLAVVALSWLLVVGGLYTATVIVGAEAYGGMAYFALYAIITALGFGIALPLYWMTVVRGRPLADLGITRLNLGKSLLIQFGLSVALYYSTIGVFLASPVEALIPLVALALTIGFFEAIFWRGWVLLRLEEAFGFVPALLIGSLLYALYHVGYGMPMDEMVFLFFIGILFAVTFRLTNSVFILWPVFQPVGQLLTLLKDGLSLPLLASVGFGEVLILMLVVVWLAARFHRRHSGAARSVVAAG